ncbi:MAG: DUF3881 family protein [Lachnospiraceae bacterium]|nr:DUF3881 family protein [Lachnospiraceae bacterium]
MHKYLRAVGFSEKKSRKEIHELIILAMKEAQQKNYTSLDDKELLAEYCFYLAEGIGICVRGVFDENDVLHYEYYFPFLTSAIISSTKDISIERHAEKESYAGVCDDMKVGVSLIFYLQNMITYLKLKSEKRLKDLPTTLTLTALSCQGSIMMPIEKHHEDEIKAKKAMRKRNRLIEEARRGNEEAIESLTMEDMDTYSEISYRIHREDIYSLVDTYFMPYGVECDQYSVLGEIKDCRKVANRITGEECYILTVNSNDLLFDVCINAKDLYGEPQIGRRFKGSIWMQGYVNYPDM